MSSDNMGRVVGCQGIVQEVGSGGVCLPPRIPFLGPDRLGHEVEPEAVRGREERLLVLERFFPPARSVVAHARAVLRSGLVADDDVIDALAAAFVARLGGFRTMPDQPERDGVGLPMEMVYAEGASPEAG